MGVSRLVEAIHWLEERFDRHGLRRSYGGAVAYNYYGPLRFTQDIDVLALVPDLKIPAFLDDLAAGGCLRGAPEPQPLDLRAVLADFRAKSHMSRFLCLGVRTEIFVPWHPFHHRVLERSPERDLEGRRIRIHAAEDLIVFKKIFDRPKDIMDIKAVLMAQKGKLDLVRLKSDARGLLTDESSSELEALIGEYG